MSTRILIVDDERPLVAFLEQMLALELPASSVDGAYSGEEALSCMAQHTYDLIIADLRMPGFDGLELVKGVRYLDPDVPIVLMTGFGSKPLQKEASQLGVTHYIDKPFEVEDLLVVIQDLVSPAGREQGD